MKTVLLLSVYTFLTVCQQADDDMFDWGQFGEDFMRRAASRGKRLNVVRGDGNFVKGRGNLVIGQQNSLDGNDNELEGDGNVHIGSLSKIKGKNNWVVGNNQIVQGDNIKYFGPEAITLRRPLYFRTST